MQAAYRQIAALLLGALVLLTSLHYMVGWSRLYDVYYQHHIAEQESTVFLSQVATGNAEKNIALTHCAAILEGDAETAVDYLVGESTAPNGVLQLSIIEGGQPLSVDVLLERANQSARYQMRYCGQRKYVIEVDYD